MSEVNTSEMWQKWMGEVLNVVAPNGLGKDQTFSGGSAATPIDLNDPNYMITNNTIFQIGDVVPANSPSYTPAPSGLCSSYSIFLDYIELDADANANLDSQINIATEEFNSAQTTFNKVQTAAFTAYAAYKEGAVDAGIKVPPFTTWVVANYPTWASAQKELSGAQSALDGLNIEKYGPGYAALQNARALVAYTAGGAQDITTQSPNNMAVATGSISPPGSKKVSIGDAPADPASSLIESFAPAYELGADYAATYAKWQADSVNKVKGASIAVSSSSRDYDYSQFGWSASVSAGWSGWFRSASAQASAKYNTISVDTNSTDFSMTVDFVGLSAVGINPGKWWQNGSLVSNYKDQLKDGHPDFFSDEGTLARRAYQLVLGFQPSVKIKMSAADYNRVKTDWQSQASARGSFGPFSFGASSSANSSKDDIHYDDAAATITITPGPSTMPVLLGVISSKL